MKFGYNRIEKLTRIIKEKNVKKTLDGTLVALLYPIGHS